MSAETLAVWMNVSPSVSTRSFCFKTHACNIVAKQAGIPAQKVVIRCTLIDDVDILPYGSSTTKPCHVPRQAVLGLWPNCEREEKECRVP
jgi:hypothetical protein